MELNTAEKFLLIAHHPEKGRFLISDIQINFGIVGSKLLDMSLDNKLSIENDRLIVKSSGKDSDTIVSEILTLIRQSQKPRKIRYWVSKIARKARKYKWVILNDLEDKRLIRVENKKFLRLIPYKKTYLIDNRSRNALIQTVRNNVLYHKELDDENVSLLGLVEACKMHRIFSSDRNELKQMRKELKEIIKASPIAGTVAKTIREVQAAIIGAVVATTAASAAAGSH